MHGEVPRGWSRRRLGEFCKGVTRLAGDADLPVLSVSKVLGIVPQAEKFKRRVASADTSRYRRVRFGEYAYDPMLLWDGSIARQESVPEGVISPAYEVFRIDHSVDTDFLFQLLKCDEMVGVYRNLSVGTNVRRRQLPFDTFACIERAFPPLPEQKKIAAILSSVDDAIRASQAVLDQTRRVKEGLLQELLTRGIGPDGRPHTRFKQTEIGEVPEGWEVARLGQVAEIRSGLAKNSSKTLHDPVEVPYLRVANVQDGYIDLSEVKAIEIERSELNRFRLRTGDVLMNEGGDIDKLGRGDVWGGQLDPCIHQNHVFSVRCGPKLAPHFLAAVSESARGKKYFLDSGKQSTNLASINKSQLRDMPIPLPGREEQNIIVGMVASVRATQELAAQERVRLSDLKSSLLSDLLTGRVRVTP